METAIIVLALPAVPYMRRSTLSTAQLLRFIPTVRSEGSLTDDNSSDSCYLEERYHTNTVAHVSRVIYQQGDKLDTHKTPMLMDTTVPSFSFLLIVDAQIINQGNRISAMSAAPE